MPKEISLMLLISMNLWVALDKCALYYCTLLRDYILDFSLSLFESLLLLKKSQMKQLLRVEQYLAERQTAVASKFLFIFRLVDTTKAFAVRYVQQFSRHKKLQQRIETEAQNDRDRRTSELARKRQRYRELISESNEMRCQYVSRWRRYEQIVEHSDFCRKCELKS